MTSNYELASSEPLQRAQLPSPANASQWNTFKHHISNLIFICLIDIVVPLLLYFALENRIQPVYALLAASSPPFFMVIFKAVSVQSFDAIGFLMFFAFVASAVVSLVFNSPTILLLEKSLLTGVGAVTFAITLIPFSYCSNRCRLRPMVYYFYHDLIPVTRAEFGLPDSIFDGDHYIELKDDEKKGNSPSPKEVAQVYAWLYEHCSSFRKACYFMTTVWVVAFTAEFTSRITFISLKLPTSSIFLYGQIVLVVVVASCAFLQVCTMVVEREHTLAYIERWKMENVNVQQPQPHSLSTTTPLTNER